MICVDISVSQSLIYAVDRCWEKFLSEYNRSTALKLTSRMPSDRSRSPPFRNVAGKHAKVDEGTLYCLKDKYKPIKTIANSFGSYF